MESRYLEKFLRDFRFYLSRKICYPLVSPDVLQLSITNRCNLRCKSCSVWKEAKSPDSELSFKEIREIVDESVAWGIKEIHLLGGEPFLRKDWERIVSYIKSKGTFLVICSNGTLIDEKMAERIIAHKVDLISISLDGAQKETHDFLRGEQGAYDKILRGISELNKFDKSVRPQIVLILTVSNKNITELKDYVDLAYSLSAAGIYFTALVADNVYLFSAEKKHNLWIEKDYLNSLEEIFSETYDYAGSKGYHLDYPSFKLFARYFKGELTKKDWVCFAGLKRLVVTHTGHIQICGELVGNYRDKRSLKKLWSSYSAFKRRRFVKRCANYCLQDCHARPESNSFLSIIGSRFI